MSVVLAIDPGSTRSAWLVFDTELGRPTLHGISPNEELLERLRYNDSGLTINVDRAVIEWMQPRGMPTSAEEFEALFWIGRFAEAWDQRFGTTLRRLTRLKVKQHLCGSNKANDSNIRAALIDRFGGVEGKEAAVGRKASPGPLYGIAADVWAALGLAITDVDQEGASA
jgi:hypothetical protein